MSPNLWQYHKKSKRRRNTTHSHTNGVLIAILLKPAGKTPVGLLETIHPDLMAELIGWENTVTHLLETIHPDLMAEHRVDTVGSKHNVCILTGRLTTLSYLTTGWHILLFHD